MTAYHHIIIQAICALDSQMVVKLLDDDALHFGATKDIFVPYFKCFFDWLSTTINSSAIEAQAVLCHGCEEVNHDGVVIFYTSDGYFAFDIQPTSEGKFSLNQCNSYECPITIDENIGAKAFMIPYDLLANFKPDTLYLQLLSEKENMLSDIDNGNIVFWFMEDVETFLKKNTWAITKLENNGFNTLAFDTFKSFLDSLKNLNSGLRFEDYYRHANLAYNLVNQCDDWDIYEWYHKQKGHSGTWLYPSLFDLTNIHFGYFTFSDYYPNLRFSVYGHQEFLKFINNVEEAYIKTEKIRSDYTLEDIEIEWAYEDLINSINPEDDLNMFTNFDDL